MKTGKEVKIIWIDKTMSPLTATLVSSNEWGITVNRSPQVLFIPYTSMRVFYQDEDS